MPLESLSALLANEAIVMTVGHEAFARGAVYARTGRVSQIHVDAQARVLSGRVQGSHHDGYLTSVSLAEPLLGAPAAHSTRCTCPVATDCKHAAALMVAARALPEVVGRVEQPAWEKALSRLVSAPNISPSPTPVPLGLEFDVQEVPASRGYPGHRELRIRPIKRGKSGAWVRSGISWDDLDYTTTHYRAEQWELLAQVRAAAGLAARYTYPKSPWMSLAAVTGGIWSLLEAASGLDVVLLTAGSAARTSRLSAVRLASGRATVGIDTRRSPQGNLVLAPQVCLEDQPLALSAVGWLGERAHGLFHYAVGPTPGAEVVPSAALVLARLDQPLSTELRLLVTSTAPVIVPAADEGRFLSDFYPRLRRKAPISSSDSSVPLPNISGPILTVTCAFTPGHRLRLDWGWDYTVGEAVRHFSLDEPAGPDTLRDVAEEQRLLTSLPLPYDRLPQLAANTAQPSDAQVPAAHALLADLQVVFFAEQLRPRLEQSGVQVTVTGDVPDYRRVDTAPVVELRTAERDESSDWFDLHIQVSIEGEVMPFDQLFIALSRGDEFMVLDTGVYVPLDRPELHQLRMLIDEARVLADHDRPGLRISRFQAGLWEELLHLGVVIEQSDRWAKTVGGLVSLTSGDGVTSVDVVEVPETLQAELRPYQLDGYRWLAFLFAHGLGGILADDMGLGKTVQTLALVCRARLQEPTAAPFLVVAPTSVVGNWATESARFAPSLKVVTITESEARRSSSLAELVAGADLVVTSYTLLRIDFAAYAGSAWTGMLLDEAQFVKNHQAKTYHCVRRLDAPFKLAITGTPLENSLMDLWSLLSITAPGLFPHPERFSEFYRRPIERARDPVLLRQLQRRIRPLMLRRTKEDVAADLPPKQEQVVEVVLQPRHLRIYQTHLQRERQKVLGLIDDLDKNRFTILASLTLLRQLSLDPSLVDTAHTGVPASKIDVLVEHLDEIVKEGHRALVFSQFTGFLGRIKQRLDAEGVSYAYLDGRTRNRARVIDGFKGGEASVFLVSLKAGGVGLNLTEADYCFVLDPWWNPAAEAQAVDRTHRIGQTKKVMVYRLVAKDTIEEKVMELKARKEGLFSSVMGDDALGSAALGADDIRGLLGV